MAQQPEPKRPVYEVTSVRDANGKLTSKRKHRLPKLSAQISALATNDSLNYKIEHPIINREWISSIFYAHEKARFFEKEAINIAVKLEPESMLRDGESMDNVRYSQLFDRIRRNAAISVYDSDANIAAFKRAIFEEWRTVMRSYCSGQYDLNSGWSLTGMVDDLCKLVDKCV